MISIFIPEDYEEYLPNDIYPSCASSDIAATILERASFEQVFDHPHEESALDLLTHPGISKHSIINGGIIRDTDSTEQSFFIKLGGTARLIQDESYYFAKSQRKIKPPA
ncbi:hypothetical protein [Paenibacillus senegalensis]|uniref:hypothetical protein n=1 Tax=Paenibacillus senegalensis TaxID=1465766 RepID=UPI000289BF83|nr:hypothetical protein [Paenibacillus senegalensis]